MGHVYRRLADYQSVCACLCQCMSVNVSTCTLTKSSLKSQHRLADACGECYRAECISWNLLCPFPVRALLQKTQDMLGTATRKMGWNVSQIQIKS